MPDVGCSPLGSHRLGRRFCIYAWAQALLVSIEVGYARRPDKWKLSKDVSHPRFHFSNIVAFCPRRGRRAGYFNTMGSFIGFIVVFVIACIIVRALRARYEWIDGLFYIALIAGVIITWIAANFWWAVGVGVVGVIIVGLLLGTGHEVKLELHCKTYTFECKECGYNRVNVSYQGNNVAHVKCPRCGNQTVYILE